MYPSPPKEPYDIHLYVCFRESRHSKASVSDGIQGDSRLWSEDATPASKPVLDASLPCAHMHLLNKAASITIGPKQRKVDRTLLV